MALPPSAPWTIASGLGEARVERLVFEPDPNELPVIVEADRLVLRLSASLESPSVTYIDDDPGSSEDDTDIALFLGLVGDVRATKGTFHWLHPREWLSVSGIELEALLANGAHRIAAHGGEGRIFVGNREIYFGPSDLDATLDAEGLHLASGTVFVDDSFVRAEGTLRFDKATTTDLDLSFALDGALARLIDEELSLEGVLSGEALPWCTTRDLGPQLSCTHGFEVPHEHFQTHSAEVCEEGLSREELA